MPLSTLNDEQRQAVMAPPGHNLVIASAGTGKTSTIVGRISRLLSEGIDPEGIVLLTFTNKAAGEMLARLKRFFPDRTVDSIESGTFHAVCYRWLKEYDPEVTLKQPSELRTLFRSIYEKRNFSRMNISSEVFSASYLYDMYNLYQNASLDTFDEWLLQRYPDHESYMDVYIDICEEYERTKKEFSFVSFNDLLLHTKKYIENGDRIFSEILVDEYQDTNTLQGSLIDRMNSKSLFCVGDYDQSIYAFNGANIENISTFTQRYPDARVYTLKTNYRSGASILSLANRVIEHNERIYPKSLEVGKRGESYPPRLLVYDELFEQYRSIAHMIKSSYAKEEDIAVIFRNNASADGIEAALREQGVSCRRKGGTSFFEAKEVKFLLDTMTLVVNPRDMMAFIHIFEYGKGIGTASAKEMFHCLQHFGEGSMIRGVLDPAVYTLPKLNPTKNHQLGLFDDDMEIGSVGRFADIEMSERMRGHPILKYPRLGRDGFHFFREFHDLFSSLRRSTSPSAILSSIIGSGLYANIVEQLAQQRARSKNGELDEERFKEAKERISRKARLLMDLSRQYRDTRRFLNAMILGGNELSEGQGVNLLTVHASKGLEFSDVYVIDLMDGRFPNRKLMGKSGSGIEEERRLFYVAVTRAKDRLYLSYAKYDRVKKSDFKPSQFLSEAGLIEA
jgi:DNA helicase-2/ATP-dependent DNA helicase PcrA